MKPSHIHNLNQRIPLTLAAALLAVFAGLCLQNIYRYSPTYDEPKFLQIGQQLASGEGWRTEMSVVHAPLSFYTHGFLLKPFQFSGELQRLRWARVTMLPYSLILGLLIFVWARDLFGAEGGLAALALYVFNSNILAHSSLITTDIIYACFSLLTLYFFWKFLCDGGSRWILACGLSMGLSLLAKYSAVIWFALLPALALAIALFWRRRPDEVEPAAVRPLKLVAAIAMIFAVAIVVLNAGYGFSGSFFQLGEYHYQSRLLARLSHNPLTDWIPVPAPYPFVRGFDAQKHIAEVGHSSFLAGMRSTNGWWYYFPLALLLKIPLAFWPMMGLTVFASLRNGDRRRKTAQLLLASSSIAIIASHSLLSRSQAGFRYIIVALPPLFILAGAVPALFSSGGKRIAVGTLIALYIAPAIWFHPHHLSYFSMLIGGPKRGYKWLSDSNLDWGQDYEQAVAFARKSTVPVAVNPGILPVPGRILVNATTLQDCFSRDDIHAWLREFEPVAHIGYSWLVYDLDEKHVAARAPDKRRLPDEYYLAAFAYADDRLHRARRLAEAALEKQPQLSEALYTLGLANMGLGHLDEAFNAFALVPESHPLRLDALGNLSFLAALKGDTAASKTFQKQAMVQDTFHSYARTPRPPADLEDEYKVHNNRGVFLWAEGNLSEAEREVRAALELEPDFCEGWANLAAILEERGALAEALDIIQRYERDFLLIEHSPFRDYRIYYEGNRIMLGDTLEIYPRPNSEILSLKASLLIHPNDPSAINRLAILLMRSGRFAEAYETLQRGLAAGIKDAGACYNKLAVLYMQKKMYSHAALACRQALEKSPGQSTVAELLAVLEEKLAISESAEKALQ
ncbi:MAG: phospholipid carrier-dependent glycosyltransferase [Candidatus Abyssobacteria bacterium SURF_5]|uniref:Phospholipid carrier-dependent glycosyltransferase n=1 Tax=Abyssobacteria bacterium (strain SURF_5) TaxID=2093360 RepID=A0A3A4NWQ1_ABYX5|nr:MAG: phospholipid carrier-dependent glycosyltransferase [Candidatus Abyssubacteria bacterium SURF_5]